MISAMRAPRALALDDEVVWVVIVGVAAIDVA